MTGAVDNASPSRPVRPASPYSTGGGGHLLEHSYGAVALAALLTGNPLDGLGDDHTVTQVRFQQKAVAPVDDLVIIGRPTAITGAPERTMFVDVRRNPGFTAGNSRFIDLMTRQLAVVIEHSAGIATDAVRLGIALSGPDKAAQEVRQLADLARAQHRNTSFRDAVAAARTEVRMRLDHMDRAVGAAAPAAIRADPDRLPDLTWQWLRAVRVIELRLEGDVASDRTDLVRQLRRPEITIAAADDLRRRLTELAGGFSTNAATVDLALLNRRLGWAHRSKPARIRTAGRKIGTIVAALCVVVLGAGWLSAPADRAMRAASPLTGSPGSVVTLETTCMPTPTFNRAENVYLLNCAYQQGDELFVRTDVSSPETRTVDVYLWMFDVEKRVKVGLRMQCASLRIGREPVRCGDIRALVPRGRTYRVATLVKPAGTFWPQESWQSDRVEGYKSREFSW